MKRLLFITLFAAAAVSALLLTLFVKTTTANGDISAGNEAYAAQDYVTALQRYTAAQSQAPGQVEPAYDAANTYYRQNVLDKAQQTLEQTLAQPNHALAEFVHYNLGNIAYGAKQFDAAIAQYEAALRLQPGDRDAKHNLELALRQKQQQDQQKPQQQQNQNQQNHQQQNQDQQRQDQQKQQGQQNQDQQNQQNQTGGQQDPRQKQQNQQNGQPGGQQDRQQQNQPEQHNGQQGDQQNQQQDQQQSQQAGQQAGQPQQPQSDQRGGQPYGARPEQGLTPEQAKRLLATVGGNGKTLLEQLQLMYMASGDTPDKDW